MIIKDERASLGQGDNVVETPPPYSPTNAAGDVPSPSGPTIRTTQRQPPQLPRSNFLSIKRRNDPLKDTFLIDPDLDVPELMLSPLEPGEERKNLQLQCDNGSINAEVWLVPRDETNERAGKDRLKKAATIDVRGHNGPVNVKMNADESRPFHLTVTSMNGGVTIALPRTFTGPLTTQTPNGWVALSSSLAPCVTTFSDVKSTRKCFVGDFASSNYGQGEWGGSSLSIDCRNGKIRLYFVDELEAASEGQNRSKFWGKLFGP